MPVYVEPLRMRTNVLPISELVSLQTALFMFRLRNNFLPEVFNHYFTLNCSIHNYKTRNAQNIHPPLNRILITQSSIFYHGSILWNNLQTSIKSSKTVKQIKRLYKQFLFDAMYMYHPKMFPPSTCISFSSILPHFVYS